MAPEPEQLLMRRARWLLLLPALAGCSLITGDAEPSCLEITVPDHAGNFLEDGEWKPNFTLAGDPRGLLGIEAAGFWGGEELAFAASGQVDPPVRGLPTDCFIVPESGPGMMDVKLTQDGQVVAEGFVVWEFAPNSIWRIDIQRSVHPPTDVEEWPPGNKANPRICSWFWCDSAWAFPVRAEAANYEGETLWLVIWHYLRGECADICDVDGYTVS